MKKQFLLGSAMVLAIGAAYADNEAAERAKDHAQPVPNASLTTATTVEQKKIVTSSAGEAVSTTKSVTLTNSETGQVAEAETSELVLPEGQIVDPDLDLSGTVDVMQDAFARLQAADSIETMREPANIMAEYAGQATALIEHGDTSGVIDPQQALTDLEQLRASLVELNSAMIANDFALAKTRIDVIALAQDGFYRHFSAQQ